MRTLTFLLIIVGLSTMAFGQAIIKFDTDTIKVDTVYFPVPDLSLKNNLQKKVNLGKVKFLFQNTGNEALIIQSVIDNGVGYCTFSKNIIPTGGKGFVEVAFFDDNYNEGNFLKYVTIDGNFVGQYKKIYIKGYKKRK